MYKVTAKIDESRLSNFPRFRPYKLTDSEWIVKDTSEVDAKLAKHGFKRRDYNINSANGSMMAQATTPKGKTITIYLTKI